MANVGASLDPIHLQPKHDISSKKSKDKPENIVPYVGAMAALLLGAVVVAAIPMLKYKDKQDEKKDLENRIEELAQVEQVYNTYYSTVDKLTDMETFYLSTCNSTEWAVEFINYIEKEMPSSMKFNSLTISEGLVTMAGVTMQEYEVAGFLNSLESEKHITSVATTGYTKDYTTGIVAFDLTMNLISDDLLVEETTTGEEAN